MDGEELKRELAKPSAWPSTSGIRSGREAEVLETHISWLFFRGRQVYKVKKPVKLPFLDFSTLELRRHFCEEEDRLNRRLAPDVYRGVVPILRRTDGGLEFGSALDRDAENSVGEIVEWAVSMERLSAHGMLDAHLDAGEVDNELLGRIADVLVRFHANARTGPGVDEHGDPERVLANALDNFEETRPWIGAGAGPSLDGAGAGPGFDGAGAAEAGGLGSTPPGGFQVFTPRTHAFLEAATRAFVSEHGSLLAQRVRDGCIRDGHGDLHAGNIHVSPEAVRAYDCIEFKEEFRCGDVASDLAFLAMDLDLRGYPAFSKFLVRRYAELADDLDLRRVIGFYKGYRAMVRCKVACMTAAGLDASATPERREALRREARRYANLALGYVLHPGLVLTCGLPGTGKSWVAKAIATPLRAAHVRSDVRRKVLAGLRPDESAAAGWGQGLYTPELRERTYRSLLDSEVHALLTRRPVVVDAAFPKREQRQLFVDAAARLGRPFHVVHVTADEAWVREHLAERNERGHDPSDADWAVYERAREGFDSPDEVPPGARIELRAQTEAPEDTAARVLEGMLPRSGTL